VVGFCLQNTTITYHDARKSIYIYINHIEIKSTNQYSICVGDMADLGYQARHLFGSVQSLAVYTYTQRYAHIPIYICIYGGFLNWRYRLNQKFIWIFHYKPSSEKGDGGFLSHRGTPKSSIFMGTSIINQPFRRHKSPATNLLPFAQHASAHGPRISLSPAWPSKKLRFELD